MKILSIGNFGLGWDGSICDEEHIAKALEKLGHEVVRAQRGEVSFVNNDPEFDFVLIAQWDGYDEAFIPLMKQTIDAPIVYWAFDYQADGQEWHERLVRESDLYLSKRIADSKYPNWQWLSQDFAPDFLKPLHPAYRPNQVVFTGSYLPWAEERNKTLAAVDKEFDLTIYSVTPDEWKQQGFKHVYGPAMDEQLPEVLARFQIVLSIDHTIEAGYWSDRPAQSMACGSFVLHRYQPLAEVRFKNKLAYFHNIEDCLTKIDFYLHHPQYRERIAKEGENYAQEELMVKNRVLDLLTIVKENR